MLYEDNGLTEKSHTVKLTNLPVTNGQQFGIDYAVVNQLPSSSSSRHGPIQSLS